jgi:2-dehydro-3-deoxygalactonokinase
MSNAAVICVDMGTTNTRLWLVRGGEVIARKTESVGVRNAARNPNKNFVRDTLASLVAAMQTTTRKQNLEVAAILAAGMITSPIGLHELRHISAPAGDTELSESVVRLHIPELSNAPVCLVPGVRTGPAVPTLNALEEVDLIRGEETLIVGLRRSGVLQPQSTLLNLGSHWKAISLDHAGRIASSHTTLSGELLQAVQQHTVLATALPPGRFEQLDMEWLDRGREFQKTVGVGRSFFGVRLLEQVFGVDQIAASSFLLGALIEADFTAMRSLDKIQDQVVITGLGAAAAGWKQILELSGHGVTLCDPGSIEKAFVSGLTHLYGLASNQQLTSSR